MKLDMVVKLLCLLAAGCAVHEAGASPLSNRLLPLVPGNAQIVAGMEHVDDFSSEGRIFLVTNNCNRDLDDWAAIAGIDQSRAVDQLIAVATSTPNHELDQHLLLLHGRLDSTLILKAQLENGGSRILKVGGYRILEVQPFQREGENMQDVRWLAIVENQLVLFGTPKLVEISLQRLAAGTLVDPELLNSLHQLRDDVESWNVMDLPGAMLAKHLDTAHAEPLLSAILDEANHLIIGVHYGSKTRVDFEVFSKARFDTLQPLAALEQVQHVSKAKADFRIERLAIHDNTINCTLTFAKNHIETWLQDQFKRRIQRTDIPIDPLRP